MNKRLCIIIDVNKDSQYLTRCINSLSHNIIKDVEIILTTSNLDEQLQNEVNKLVEANQGLISVCEVANNGSVISNWLEAINKTEAKNIMFMATEDATNKTFWRTITPELDKDLEMTLFKREYITGESKKFGTLDESKFAYDDFFLYKLTTQLTGKIYNKEFLTKIMIDHDFYQNEIIIWPMLAKATEKAQFLPTIIYQQNINRKLLGWKEELEKFDTLQKAIDEVGPSEAMAVFAYNQLFFNWLKKFHPKEPAFKELQAEINAFMEKNFGEKWRKQKSFKKYLKETRTRSLW